MDKVLNVLIILLFLFGTGACIVMAVAPTEVPMGVWMTDINGIPLHQTGQVGQFGIFEVIPPGGN
jgi:hypothetical protein